MEKGEKGDAVERSIFVHSGRSKGAIPNISRDRGEPLSFRPNTEKSRSSHAMTPRP